jgi:hypothetical protein
MHVVDADTHIVESEAVWDYLDEDMYSRRPIIIRVPSDTLYKTRNAFWLIDGNIRPKPAGRGGFTLHTPSVADRELNRTDTSLGSRELSDIGTRIQDMDRLGVSVQILYPTLFLVHLTEDPALEVALCQAYNRWMSYASAAASSRIKWIAVAPFADLEASLIQINYAQEHGAVGVLFRAWNTIGRSPTPISSHISRGQSVGSGNPSTRDRVRRPCPTCLTLVSAPDSGT